METLSAFYAANVYSTNPNQNDLTFVYIASLHPLSFPSHVPQPRLLEGCFRFQYFNFCFNIFLFLPGVIKCDNRL